MLLDGKLPSKAGRCASVENTLPIVIFGIQERKIKHEIKNVTPRCNMNIPPQPAFNGVNRSNHS